ncbi:MAG: DUF177 domain-containing protein [Ignavibacteria bacterium]|nr:DUF177 domain-containing protein [Ignavibacteria bacterium]
MAIKINIGSLNDGSQQLELVSNSAELGLADGILKDPVLIGFELFKTNFQLDVKTKISGTIFLECDRCLDNFEKSFETGFELVFVQQHSREEAINEEYIRTYPAHMKTVDLTNDIKETILLTIPMKKLPPEKEDGSCSWCGRTKEFWSGILVDKDEDDE